MIELKTAAALAAFLVVTALSGLSHVYGAECGIASWYGPGFHGNKSASGERFNQNAMTAAHKSLPFGTVVTVKDQRTGKTVTVTINDRGPYYRGRIIDLSKAAAIKLGIVGKGTGKVCLRT